THIAAASSHHCPTVTGGQHGIQGIGQCGALLKDRVQFDIWHRYGLVAVQTAQRQPFAGSVFGIKMIYEFCPASWTRLVTCATSSPTRQVTGWDSSRSLTRSRESCLSLDPAPIKSATKSLAGAARIFSGVSYW